MCVRQIQPQVFQRRGKRFSFLSLAHRMGEGGRRPGEGRGENLNNQVAEILSRSRKVRTRIPNKTNFVTARDDGAKGQRPPQGRAGAGLASPARTGAGADAILMTQRSRKLVLTLALTFNPLPQERKSRRHVFIFSADHPANPVARISKDAANDSPSPPTGVGGENPSPAGAGEGGRRPVEGRAEQNQICGRGEVARDTN